MLIFDFLKKLWGWTDESNRKRRADSDIIEECISPKKQRCEHRATETNDEFFDIDDDSDSDEIQIIKEKYSVISPCRKVNGTRGHKYKGYNFYSPCSVISKPVYSRPNNGKFNMGHFANRNHKIPNNDMDNCNCPTLRKTHRLKEKDQYQELLQLFKPHQRIDVLQNKHVERRPSKEKVELVDLEMSNSSSSSYKSPQISRASKIMSKLQWETPKEQPKKDTERGASSSFKKDDVVLLYQKDNKRKDESVIGKSITINHIETVPTNSLRDHLTDKAVVKNDFIPQVMKKYNERIEQRYQEVEELQKFTRSLSAHNRSAREAALEKLIRTMRLSEVILDEREEPEEPELPILTDDMLKEVQNALIPRPPDEILVEGFGLRITRKDIHTLADLNWLNDEVINYYMNLLIARGTDDKYPKVHAMNTFFYPKLISSGHSSLKRWTRKIDIFAQDLIVVPVHLGIHWCMSIIDFRNKSISYYDSMGNSNMKCLSALRQYLEEESLDKKKKAYDTSDWKLECAKDIPQQMNGSDCGVFSCMFAEYICANKKITFTQSDMPYFRQKMVYEILKTKLL